MNSAPLVSKSEVSSLLGTEYSELLYELDHNFLDYGKHWRLNGQAAVYTLEGLRALSVLFANRAQAKGDTEMKLVSESLASKAAKLEEQAKADAHAAAVEARQLKEIPSRKLVRKPAPTKEPYYRQGSLA
ncbi:hypothetical protein [Oleiharenicola lentus]|uniref:hypothetical protein n=1 Tax=Oleiharenicola lentus TaxID=2508720 RepID=UPI003F67E076